MTVLSLLLLLSLNSHAKKLAPPVYQHIEVNFETTCALTTEGELQCWAESSIPRDLPVGETFTQFELGTSHACGLTPDQRVLCWGCEDRVPGDECDVPDHTFVHVSAGNDSSCGITTEGAVVCWGCKNRCDGNTDDFGVCDPPDDTFKTVVTNNNHSCGITTDEQVRCWGCQGNAWGDPVDHGQCKDLHGTLRQVVLGPAYTCALNASGKATCWGLTSGVRTRPDDLPNSPLAQLAATEWRLCGIKPDETLYCWPNFVDKRPYPTDVHFQQIDIALKRGCGVTTDGALQCWGNCPRGLCPPGSHDSPSHHIVPQPLSSDP